jgi:hypothetical protein
MCFVRVGTLDEPDRLEAALDRPLAGHSRCRRVLRPQ